MARFRVSLGPVPMHHQVYLDLRGSLDDRTWQPGDRLPPERELAQRYGVSLITVRRALSELAQQGRIERTRGRGTFVLRPRLERDIAAAIHAPETRARILAMGFQPTGTSADELERIQRLEFDRWAAVVKASGYKAEQ